MEFILQSSPPSLVMSIPQSPPTIQTSLPRYQLTMEDTWVTSPLHSPQCSVGSEGDNVYCANTTRPPTHVHSISPGSAARMALL